VLNQMNQPVSMTQAKRMFTSAIIEHAVTNPGSLDYEPVSAKSIRHLKYGGR